MIVKKESAWQFITSGSGGLGVEFLAVEGGVIYLQDPTGAAQSFTYGAPGVGISYGFKLPKIGKLQLKGKSVTSLVAPTAFPNMGKLYILDTFAGDELTRSDIAGVCIFGEVGGGFIAGGSGTAMLLGMDPLWLAMFAGGLPLITFAEQGLLASAKAVLVMAGINVGIQASIGANVYMGGLF